MWEKQQQLRNFSRFALRVTSHRDRLRLKHPITSDYLRHASVHVFRVTNVTCFLRYRETVKHYNISF